MRRGDRDEDEDIHQQGPDRNRLVEWKVTESSLMRE